MLLLVLLSALGMCVVSLPVGTGESAGQYHGAAVARNMARAGVNAAIARFPAVNTEGNPYVRRIPIGSNAMGRYSVTSQKADAGIAIRPAAVPGFVEYDLVSVGSVNDFPARKARIVAKIRFGPDPAGNKVRILKWEESAPR